jgi:hypothetical protein
LSAVAKKNSYVAEVEVKIGLLSILLLLSLLLLVVVVVIVTLVCAE